MSWKNLPSGVKGVIIGLVFMLVLIFLVVHYRFGESYIEKYVNKLQGIKEDSNLIDRFIPFGGAESRLVDGNRGYNLRELEDKKSGIFLRLNLTDKIESTSFQYRFIKKGQGDSLVLSLIESNGNKQILWTNSEDNLVDSLSEYHKQISLKNYLGEANISLVFELKVSGEVDSLVSMENFTLYPKNSFELYQNYEDRTNDSFFTLEQCNAFSLVDRKSNCIKNLVLFEKDPSLCKIITVSSIKSECYRSLALLLNDKKYCNLIEDENQDFLRNMCIVYLAINQNKTDECNSLEGLEFGSHTTWKETCIGHVAFSNKDPAICEQIKTDLAKKDCYNLLGF